MTKKEYIYNQLIFDNNTRLTVLDSLSAEQIETVFNEIAPNDEPHAHIHRMIKG